MYCEWQSHSKERSLLKDKIRLFLRLFQLFCHGWRLHIQLPVWMQTSDKLDKKLLMKNKLIGTSVDTHLLMFTLEVKEKGKSIKSSVQLKSNFLKTKTQLMKYNLILHHKVCYHLRLHLFSSSRDWDWHSDGWSKLRLHLKTFYKVQIFFTMILRK